MLELVNMDFFGVVDGKADFGLRLKTLEPREVSIMFLRNDSSMECCGSILSVLSLYLSFP